MNKQTSSTLFRRLCGGRLRLVAGAVLSAGLLLVTAACSDNGFVPEGKDDAAKDGAAEAKSAISTLKVCELVDLEPLTTRIRTRFAKGPSNIDRGVGSDAAGQQCYAQIELPKVRSGKNSTPIAMINANLNVAVAPYSSTGAAAAEYDRRIAEVQESTSDERVQTDLSGGWTRGKLIVGVDSSTAQVYALVQQDSYLLKFALSYTSDKNYFEGYPFTQADLGTAAQEIMTPLHAAVTAKVAGEG